MTSLQSYKNLEIILQTSEPVGYLLHSVRLWSLKFCQQMPLSVSGSKELSVTTEPVRYVGKTPFGLTRLPQQPVDVSQI